MTHNPLLAMQQNLEHSLKVKLAQGPWEFKDHVGLYLSQLRAWTELPDTFLHLRLARQTARMYGVDTPAQEHEAELQRLTRAPCPIVQTEAASLLGLYYFFSCGHYLPALQRYQQALQMSQKLGHAERFCAIYMAWALALVRRTNAPDRHVHTYLWTLQAWACRSAKPLYLRTARAAARQIQGELQMRARRRPSPRPLPDITRLPDEIGPYQLSVLAASYKEHAPMLQRRDWLNYLSVARERQLHLHMFTGGAIAERALVRDGAEDMLNQVLEWLETRQAEGLLATSTRFPALDHAIEQRLITNRGLVRVVEALFPPRVDTRPLPSLPLINPALMPSEAPMSRPLHSAQASQR